MSRLGHQLGQRPYPVARLACGNTFQHLAHGEQEDHYRRLFCRPDEEGADGSYRHQAFDGEGLSQSQGREGALRHRRNANQAGRDESPRADPGYQILDDPGPTEQ